MTRRPYTADANLIPRQWSEQAYALTEADMVTLRLLQKDKCEFCNCGFEIGDLVFQVGSDHLVCAYLDRHQTNSVGASLWHVGRIREDGKYYLKFNAR